VGPIRHCA